MHILLHRRRASESQSVQGQFDMVQAGERRSQHAHTMCHSSPSRDSTHDLLGQDDDCLGEVLMAAFAKFLTQFCLAAFGISRIGEAERDMLTLQHHFF